MSDVLPRGKAIRTISAKTPFFTFMKRGYALSTHEL